VGRGQSGNGTPRSPVDADGRSRTKRSERTRRVLIDDARKVFGRTGFHDAKIADIMESAGLAHGTFYTHFESKEEIFLAVLAEVMEESFIVTGGVESGVVAAPIDRIDMANRRYLEFYAANARILASIDQLALVDERFDSLRQTTRRAYISRIANAVGRWQQHGLADQDVDAERLAAALGAMAERMAYLGFVAHDGPTQIDEMLEVLNHVWAGALGLGQRTPSQR
jgi:AcrR family transcriptional regulator